MHSVLEMEHSIAEQAAQADAEAFLDRSFDIINAGAQAIMLSIGHRSGLFDVLAGLEQASSREIADSANLNERYVREWLASMVTAKIVDYDPGPQTYSLPRAHADCLTRAGALGNVAVFAQHVALMGAMQEQTLHCLESGTGTSYGDYPCFHQIMAEDSEQTVVNALFEHVLPLVEGIDARLRSGIEVMDAGCGKGFALLALAAAYPRSHFTGFDLCADAIADANRLAASRGLDNIRFEVQDLSCYDERGRYDLVTSFDAVHDQRDPRDLIRRIARALKPSGTYLMQDIGGSARLENNLDFPMASLFYAISLCHCTPISIGQGGQGIGTMWGWETAQAMLHEAGFDKVERHVLPHDPTNVWFVSRGGRQHG